MFSPPHGGSTDVPEQEQVQRRERRLVLLVDDCQDTRELYAEYLELSGFDVKEADDGIVAISEAVRVNPDIIVMDMSLPRLDGREAAQQLRADERTRRIPLVLISGYDADNLPANNGLWDHYLGKPCPPEELVSVIGRLVA
jgi:two-component system, cell cycle response regulator DivK